MNDYDDFDTSTFHISWTNINSGAQAIVANINNNNIKPDVIISPQDDVIAASLVATQLDVPLAIAHLNPRRDGGVLLNCLPKVSRPIRSGEYEQGGVPKITIISTLIDNERNVDNLVEHYKKRGHEVTTMSIYSRKNAKNPPDYRWVLLVPRVHTVFPWEEI